MRYAYCTLREAYRGLRKAVELWVEFLVQCATLLHPTKIIAGAIALCATATLAVAAQGNGTVIPLGPGVRAETLAVIVNDKDAKSIAIAEYYRTKRSIPQENMLHVSFKPDAPVMSVGEFASVKDKVDALAPDGIQAYALTWAAPYRVDCMSITSAFAFGFDRGYCAQGCKATKASPYFNSPSVLPFHDHKIRPTISIAGSSVTEAKKLIDRGIIADGARPRGTAYLVTTPDRTRSVRSVYFPLASKAVSPFSGISVVQISAPYIENRNDIMFYFTGATRVPKIGTNAFLPGAIADHLTSTGGQLTNSSQMSALRWLDAGATGSYGTVVEPCNIPAKFPNPALVIGFYSRGATLVEAYWKSVAMPGQGIFIGEPLARPY